MKANQNPNCIELKGNKLTNGQPLNEYDNPLNGYDNPLNEYDNKVNHLYEHLILVIGDGIAR